MRLVNDDPVVSLLENALIAWRTRQTKARGNVSLNAFAEEIGASRSLVSMWMLGDRQVTLAYRKKIAKPIADLVGSEAYKVLDVPPPNPHLQRIIERFPNISTERQQKLAEDSERYENENERSKKAPAKRKTSSNK